MQTNEVGRTLNQFSRFAVIVITALCAGRVMAQQSVPAVTGDARVDKILSQMTLEEKLTLIHGARRIWRS